ncbi:DUF2065 family protein [uncultured Ferrimonas sp.]|uniref:DUF2065 domain-containing protein n=1 Tax=uncultured Ferrimonas sp. TaxID=432640 RepID=UPI00261278EA|nr:DUF2065 family protein [uncultured Ferrimonas sp.]
MQTAMMILAGVLLVEGLGPLLFPKQWQRLVTELAQQHPDSLRRVGGCLVTAALVLLWIFSA